MTSIFKIETSMLLNDNKPAANKVFAQCGFAVIRNVQIF